MSNMMGLRVAANPCDQCLFSKNRIVSAERATAVIAGCIHDEQHFVCHKYSIKAAEGTMTEDDANVCCAGFFREYPNASALMQIAQRLGYIHRVDADGVVVEQKERP